MINEIKNTVIDSTSFLTTFKNLLLMHLGLHFLIYEDISRYNKIMNNEFKLLSVISLPYLLLGIRNILDLLWFLILGISCYYSYKLFNYDLSYEIDNLIKLNKSSKTLILFIETIYFSNLILSFPYIFSVGNRYIIESSKIILSIWILKMIILNVHIVGSIVWFLDIHMYKASKFFGRSFMNFTPTNSEDIQTTNSEDIQTTNFLEYDIINSDDQIIMMSSFRF